VDTSTKVFVVWKSFGWIFFRISIQNSHASLCQVPRKLMPRKLCNFRRTIHLHERKNHAPLAIHHQSMKVKLP
jgi:hypothetical protein